MIKKLISTVIAAVMTAMFMSAPSFADKILLEQLYSPWFYGNVAVIN